MYWSKIISLFSLMLLVASGLPAIEEAQQVVDNVIPQHVLINGNESINGEEMWKVQLGDICQLNRFPLPASEADKFLECLKPNDDSNEWPWEDKGVWVMKQCIAGAEFYALTRTCKSKRYIRRQQSLCQVNPSYSWCPPSQSQMSQPIIIQPQVQQVSCQCPQNVQTCICPQPAINIQPTVIPTLNMQSMCQQQPSMSMCQCQQQPCYTPPMPCPLVGGTGVMNAQVGGVCSWMLSPLAADPGNPKCFLQCHPAPGNIYCGRWVRMPCAPGTIFDVTVQVCVHDPYNPPGPVIPMPQCNCGCQSGYSSLGSCNGNSQCPGQSMCQTQLIAQSGCQQQCQPSCCYQGAYGRRK